MNFEIGDRVLLKHKQLRGRIAQSGLDPRKIFVELDNGNGDWFWISELVVVPPDNSIFEYLELVKIIKSYERRLFAPYHLCAYHLINSVGKIISYDSRDGFYLIECVGQGSGWFPPTSLVPINYQGQIFYYPDEEVVYKNQKIKIAAVRRTKSNRGQILLIEGEWIPSSHVTPLRR